MLSGDIQSSILKPFSTGYPLFKTRDFLAQCVHLFDVVIRAAARLAPLKFDLLAGELVGQLSDCNSDLMRVAGV